MQCIPTRRLRLRLTVGRRESSKGTERSYWRCPTAQLPPVGGRVTDGQCRVVVFGGPRAAAIVAIVVVERALVVHLNVAAFSPAKHTALALDCWFCRV